MRKPKTTYIYIVSRGHSGSTMLELLLNRCENLAAMGEIDMLGLQMYRDKHTRWTGKCSCNSQPNQCPVWQQVITRISNEQGIDLMKKPFSLPISDIRLAEEYGWRAPISMLVYQFHRVLRRFIHKANINNALLTKYYRVWAKNRDYLVNCYADIRGVEGVVDASKDALQMRDIIKYSELPLKVIFLTRDVRGLVWSALKNRGSSATKEASEWSRLNLRILDQIEKSGTSDWLHVRYEDLCNNLEDELNRIHSFIGITRQKLTAREEKKRRHTIAGNRMRFKNLEVIKEDKEWIEKLSINQINEIETVAMEAANKFGYNFL